jgi:hypothetical protein
MTSERPMDVLGIVGAILVGLLGVACAVYTFRTRTVADLLWNSLEIAVVVTAIIVAAAIAEWSQTKFRWPTLSEVIGIPIVAVGMGIGFYLVAVPVKDAFLFLQAFSHTEPGTAAYLALGTLAIGLCLYAARYYVRAAYGLSEALVGVLIAFRGFAPALPGTNVPPRDSAAFYLTLLTAAVYLMVRGFDNIHQGLTKDPKDKLSLYLLARIRRHSYFGPATTSQAQPATADPKRKFSVRCYRGDTLLKSYDLDAVVTLPMRQDLEDQAKRNLTRDAMAAPPYDGVRFEVIYAE